MTTETPKEDPTPDEPIEQQLGLDESHAVDEGPAAANPYRAVMDLLRKQVVDVRFGGKDRE